MCPEESPDAHARSPGPGRARGHALRVGRGRPVTCHRPRRRSRHDHGPCRPVAIHQVSGRPPTRWARKASEEPSDVPSMECGHVPGRAGGHAHRVGRRRVPAQAPVVARVTITDPADLLRFMALGLDMLEMRDGNDLFVLTTSTDVDRLRADGWTIRIDPEQTSMLERQRQEQRRRRIHCCSQSCSWARPSQPPTRCRSPRPGSHGRSCDASLIIWTRECRCEPREIGERRGWRLRR